MTTREQVVERIAETTGQHTRWLRFDVDRMAWFNGSDIVCQMYPWRMPDGSFTSDDGEGLITEWAPRHMVVA